MERLVIQHTEVAFYKKNANAEKERGGGCKGNEWVGGGIGGGPFILHFWSKKTSQI